MPRAQVRWLAKCDRGARCEDNAWRAGEALCRRSASTDSALRGFLRSGHEGSGWFPTSATSRQTDPARRSPSPAPEKWWHDDTTAHTGLFAEALSASHGQDDFGQSLGAKKQTEADESPYERRDNVGLRRDGHNGGLVDSTEYTLVRGGKAKKRKRDVKHKRRN